MWQKFRLQSKYLLHIFAGPSKHHRVVGIENDDSGFDAIANCIEQDPRTIQ